VNRPLPDRGAVDARAEMLVDIVAGLSKPRHHKTISCKWLYDARGSMLFERICELEAYYPTRTELEITGRNAKEIARLIGPDARLVELGSGSSTKTRILLDHLENPFAYVPIDISPTQLDESARRLAKEYPSLLIAPLFADYLTPFALPARTEGAGRTVVYFPGSTIGNFEPLDAIAFLGRLARLCRPRGGLLIGTDLVKDREVLERAYDDPEGVTAEFNGNLLCRLRDELGMRVDPTRFRHRASYDAEARRIVMQLVSQGAQRIQLGSFVCELEDGEAITTEHSYKFEPASFAEMARAAGLRVEKAFYDDRRYFALSWLLPA